MITLLKKSAYKESLWKNGQGKTSEIAIYPVGSSLEDNDFFWRISSAEVNQSTWFSVFKNCERKLVIWKGAGLLLNKQPILQNSPLTFSGEEKVFCEMLESFPIIDFGIIYKKDLVKVELNLLIIETPLELMLAEGLHFFFLADSKNDECHIAGQSLNSGDCLKIEEEKCIYINPSSDSSIFYQIKISGI